MLVTEPVRRAARTVGLLLLMWILITTTSLPARSTQVKVMTFNIARNVGVSAGYTSSIAQSIARIVNYYQPDVIGINELEGSNAASGDTVLRQWVSHYLPYLGSTYYTYVSPLSDGYIMNAMVSRYPILDKQCYTLNPRGIMSALIDLPGPDDLRVFTCHLKAYGDSSSAGERQGGADTAVSRITIWSGTAANAATPYVITGDMNEDEENPQTALTSTYHPITTLLTAYLVNSKPSNLYGSFKTISSTSPTRRFDYILPSWRLDMVSGQVIDTNQLFNHGQLPVGLQRLDSQGSDHLGVIETLDIGSNSSASGKALTDGRSVTLCGKTVTGVFDGQFYIEDSNRVSAIRVNSATAPSIGDIVNVTGSMAGSGAERYLSATGVRVIAHGNSLKPLAMCNRAVGGADLNSLALEAENGVGPCNVGLLITTWGRVAGLVTDGLQIDDGGGEPVTVRSASTVSVGEVVAVTGIVGYEVPTGHTRSIRVIRTRNASDVTTLTHS
jgi:endonuclease/exonuclease/phosphatase family metal-dependent hydrolase